MIGDLLVADWEALEKEREDPSLSPPWPQPFHIEQGAQAHAPSLRGRAVFPRPHPQDRQGVAARLHPPFPT